ncbi:MAG: hypothetical protein Greene101415_1164 [Parcubacteria group bacterium Greene1014_15]|nr:MAG: hypothetical protein Greene101415_1164 [Parcubacteria group bacterium Greene1014_15]
MVIPAFLNNVLLTVLCMAGSLIFLGVWFLNKPKINRATKILLPWVYIAGGSWLLYFFTLPFLALLNSIINQKSFLKLISLSLDNGFSGITFLLFLLGSPLLGIVLLITGILQLYRRHLKPRPSVMKNPD